MLFHSLLTTSANSSESPQHRPQHLSQKRRGSSSSSSSGSSSSSNSSPIICERDSGVENPFAFRTTKPPTSVYILEDTSKKTTTAATTTTSVTYLVKLLTFVLLGFAGGLLYHLTLSRDTTTGQQEEQLLQANDQIVQQLATENQQHAHELEELKREIAERQTHAGRLRQRQHQAHELTEQVLHAEEMDSHAILWTTDVHDARLDDAHKQAEALLLRARNL